MKLSGAEIIVETLLEQGCTKTFGYPGGAVLDIFDALYVNRDRIQNIRTAHEQGAAHAADGYARATGKVGVVIATSGPGATNLVTGIATAHLDSVPMVAITGNVATSLIGKDSFQEVNITGITMPITKHNYFVSDVSKLAKVIREAFSIAKSGRPGPVLIDVPKDVLTAKTDYKKQDTAPFIELPEADEKLIAAAAKEIAKCKRPYIYCGGGVIAANAGEEIMALAEKTDAYIGSSMMGLSAVPDSHPRFLGMQGMHGRFKSSKALDECDLLVVVGGRFSDRSTGDKNKYARHAKIIQFDADVAEVNKNISVTLGIVGNVKKALQSLIEKVPEMRHEEWEKRVNELRAEEQKQVSELAWKSELTPFKLIEAVRKEAGADTPVATDVGQHQLWTTQHYAFEKPRTCITSGGLGTMGFGMGAAIGASVGTGKRTVLFTGDGSFGMNLNELATLAAYQIPVIIVIMNNTVLGNVRQWQTMFYNKHYSNTDLVGTPDYMLLGEAFGIKGYVINELSELEPTIHEAFAHEGSAIIDCRINKDEFVLPMIPPGGSMENILVQHLGD